MRKQVFDRCEKGIKKTPLFNRNKNAASVWQSLAESFYQEFGVEVFVKIEQEFHCGGVTNHIVLFVSKMDYGHYPLADFRTKPEALKALKSLTVDEARAYVLEAIEKHEIKNALEIAS